VLCFALSACFFIFGKAPGYEALLDSVQLPRTARMEEASAIVVPAGTREIDVAAIAARVEGGALLITEGDSPLARALGIGFESREVEVTQVEDAMYPTVAIIWEQSAKIHPPVLPAGAKVLAKDKWSGIPLMALFSRSKGRVLFLATALEGYARFPYFMYALIHECAVTPPFRNPRLHAFFDYGYRAGVDLDYFAARWRRQGVVALHVSAWQFWDRDRDLYLRGLIAACHKQGLLVYAWFELPHVSDRFWQQHPEWREKTATLADARLDWRGLLNLLDPAAFQAVSADMQKLLADFDWDGLNLSELYFESPQGPENEQRFTPMNDLVRAEFRAQSGIDPIEFFRKGSPRHWTVDKKDWNTFVEYRAGLVARLHAQLFDTVAQVCKRKPHLHTIVTFVDNLYEERMKEALGADVRRILALAAVHPFTLFLEDPATMWSLGPDRYRVLGERYRSLNAKVGVDINVVDRYQDVFPTKKQTGGEFLELFHNAAASFTDVLVYFEASVLPQDMDMAAYALAAGARVLGPAEMESPRPVVVGTGALVVDGAPWPASLVPAGRHKVETASNGPAWRLDVFTGELLSAAYEGPRTIRFRYRADSRAIAVFSVPPSRLLVDGVASTAAMLPPGEHEVRAIQ